ncbi:MAG: hypothetical protein LBU32_18610 [Clostridiales bacterium]|jgi:hypothetical protein|nr:hypothetical protein [Clostridiales bacterium]
MNPIIVDFLRFSNTSKSAANFPDSYCDDCSADGGKGSAAKTAGAAEQAYCRRAAAGRFISIGQWDEGAIRDCIKNAAYECMLKHSQEIEKPILFSFDAAANAEAKPSRQARRPIQGAARVFSRLEGKAARESQAVA